MVDDETYNTLSRLAYKDLKEGAQIEDLPDWEVLEDTKSHAVSGFDAVTFVNRQTGEAVIAYRGTEGEAELSTSGPDLLNDVGIGLGELGRKVEIERPFDEQITKFEDAVGITGLNDWVGEQSRNLMKKADVLGTNQMFQAEDYAREMQEKHPDLNFTLTGHSLGGANAQYAAAYTGLPAVTFSAPSVIGSLSPEARRMAENGEFDSQIINFAHPGDIVASGTFGGYEGHVGSTYYIDSNYEDANDGVSLWDKIGNTFGGPNYHQLDRYKFENGYISNPLYDGETGKPVDSPRVPSDSGLFQSLHGMMNGMMAGIHGSLLGAAGAAAMAGQSAGAGTIEVTPAELRSVAETWRANAQQSQSELEWIRQRLARTMYSSHSRRLQPIVQQLDASIMSLSQWHIQHTTDMVQYIKFKADLFEQTDRSG
ncbi:lipase family protein [Paenibacillus sp. FSL R5-0810]|uniref:lipase family protein n=1 Tax=Paenibacillus sp. FSL R5-0810 TaxID=2921659 RepID=UPI0030F8A093